MRLYRTMRRISLAGLMMVALVAAGVFTSGAAEASASSCRYGGSGEFCFSVDGTGKYIRTVTFSRSKSGTITNPNVTVQVKDNNGKVIWQTIYSEAKSWYVARTIRLGIDQRFSDSARQICGQWRENGYYSEICHSLR